MKDSHETVLSRKRDLLLPDEIKIILKESRTINTSILRDSPDIITQLD